MYSTGVLKKKKYVYVCVAVWFSSPKFQSFRISKGNAVTFFTAAAHSLVPASVTVINTMAKATYGRLSSFWLMEPQVQEPILAGQQASVMVAGAGS